MCAFGRVRQQDASTRKKQAAKRSHKSACVCHRQILPESEIMRMGIACQLIMLKILTYRYVGFKKLSLNKKVWI
jgi:hypothetical protein